MRAPLEQTTAIFFHETGRREYCEQDPALGYEFFKEMSEAMIKRKIGKAALL